MSKQMIGRINRGILLAGLLVGWAMAAGPALAGVAFFPGKMDGLRFVREGQSKEAVYAIDFAQVNLRIEKDVATVRLNETLAGPETAVRGVCVIALPAGANAAGAKVSVSVPNGQPRLVENARVLVDDESQKFLQAIAAGTDSPQVMSLAGRPLLMIESFELKGLVEVHVDFTQNVRQSQGVAMLDCPLPITHFSRGAASRVSLTASIKADKPLRAIFSPTHDAAIERRGLFESSIVLKAENYRGADELRLCYVADDDPLGLRVLAYRSPGDADGYFMLLGNPTGDPHGDKPLEKDVTFVLDTSGSMRGEKIEQARAALEYCLAHLNAGDRFNIITFGSRVRSFSEGLLNGDAASLASARQFVEETVAAGNTNIGEALATALAGKSQEGRLRIMIFLTDGTPTSGERSPDKIVERCGQLNGGNTHIFVVGVGHDVNAHLLDKLAEITEGGSEYIGEGEPIDVKVAALYDRLSNPVLGNVAVECGQLQAYSLYPKKLPALFRGGQVMIFGRYREGGTQTISLTGTLAGRKVSYSCQCDFPKEAGAREVEFVAPLWAVRKIGYLLQEIRLHKDNKEMIEDVISLSRRFGIVTEYTQFLAQMAPQASAEQVYTEAHAKMASAKAQQSGRWAVNQAFNEREMQARAVAGDMANVYRDRRGKVVSTQVIRQLGNRVYYLRDGQWVDAEDAGKRATRNVKLFSDEYFDLARKDADFARAQSLGWPVTMNVGAERIVIEKDGKTQDEELKKSAPAQQQEEQQEQMQNQRFQQVEQMQQFNNEMPAGAVQRHRQK